MKKLQEISCKREQSHQVYLNAMPNAADIHGINKILKQKKFRASEYRAKFTWTMLSAAEILYQKKRPLLLT